MVILRATHLRRDSALNAEQGEQCMHGAYNECFDSARDLESLASEKSRRSYWPKTGIVGVGDSNLDDVLSDPESLKA